MPGTRPGMTKARPATSSLVFQRYAKPSGQVLHELPSDAARTGAARCRPFQRLTMQRLATRGNLVVRDIAVNHRQVLILATAVKSEPQPETVRQRNFFLNRFTG